MIADVRVRAEHVDREGLDETLAVTWRARLGYEIKTPDGWSALIEGEAVGHLNDDFPIQLMLCQAKRSSRIRRRSS